jgi:hypothetical protein
MNMFVCPLTHCIRVYSILIHTGKWGGGGELTRDKVFPPLWLEG